MTHSFDLTTALVAERQHTLRQEAHHHRLGRIARRSGRRSAARRAAAVQAARAAVVATPLPAQPPTADATPQERTAA